MKPNSLLTALAAIALGFAVSSPAWAQNNPLDFVADHDATAKAGGGVDLDRFNLTNQNTVDMAVGLQTGGVAAFFQNNGASSAINNGNTVSAIVISPQTTGNETFDVDMDVLAEVRATNIGGDDGITDLNEIKNDAFEDFQGIVSLGQTMSLQLLAETALYFILLAPAWHIIFVYAYRDSLDTVHK